MQYDHFVHIQSIKTQFHYTFPYYRFDAVILQWKISSMHINNIIIQDFGQVL